LLLVLLSLNCVFSSVGYCGPGSFFSQLKRTTANRLGLGTKFTPAAKAAAEKAPAAKAAAEKAPAAKAAAEKAAAAKAAAEKAAAAKAAAEKAAAAKAEKKAAEIQANDAQAAADKANAQVKKAAALKQSANKKQAAADKTATEAKAKVEAAETAMKNAQSRADRLRAESQSGRDYERRFASKERLKQAEADAKAAEIAHKKATKEESLAKQKKDAAGGAWNQQKEEDFKRLNRTAEAANTKATEATTIFEQKAKAKKELKDAKTAELEKEKATLKAAADKLAERRAVAKDYEAANKKGLKGKAYQDFLLERAQQRKPSENALGKPPDKGKESGQAVLRQDGSGAFTGDIGGLPSQFTMSRPKKGVHSIEGKIGDDKVTGTLQHNTAGTQTMTLKHPDGYTVTEKWDSQGNKTLTAFDKEGKTIHESILNQDGSGAFKGDIDGLPSQFSMTPPKDGVHSIEGKVGDYNVTGTLQHNTDGTQTMTLKHPNGETTEHVISKDGSFTSRSRRTDAEDAEDNGSAQLKENAATDIKDRLIGPGQSAEAASATAPSGGGMDPMTMMMVMQSFAPMLMQPQQAPQPQP
jgi:hypothetical protein